jgi:hypothetical protein
LSEAIIYFETAENHSGIAVSHAFIVTGPDEITQAHVDTGVATASLSALMQDSNVNVYFRIPTGFTPELGLRIAESARSYLGEKYDKTDILGMALNDTVTGRLLNKLFRGDPERLSAMLLAHQGREICSELAAKSLNNQPEFKGHGVLSQPLSAIDPQELFEDQILFAPDCWQT